MEGAGKLPEEALSRPPAAGAPRPVQELLQPGAGLDASGPVEAAQRGAWGCRAGEAGTPALPLASGSPAPGLPRCWPQRTDVRPSGSQGDSPASGPLSKRKEGEGSGQGLWQPPHPKCKGVWSRPAAGILPWGPRPSPGVRGCWGLVPVLLSLPQRPGPVAGPRPRTAPSGAASPGRAPGPASPWSSSWLKSRVPEKKKR